MRTVLAATAALLLFAASTPASRAGLDATAPVPQGPNLSLVVMEAPGCDYCEVFRRDVLPAYEASPRAKEMPVRFVDINDEAANLLGLDSPVDVVPTFVVLKNNKEIGRIPGYTDSEYFFHHINYLLTTAP